MKQKLYRVSLIVSITSGVGMFIAFLSFASPEISQAGSWAILFSLLLMLIAVLLRLFSPTEGKWWVDIYLWAVLLLFVATKVVRGAYTLGIVLSLCLLFAPTVLLIFDVRKKANTPFV